MIGEGSSKFEAKGPFRTLEEQRMEIYSKHYGLDPEQCKFIDVIYPKVEGDEGEASYAFSAKIGETVRVLILSEGYQGVMVVPALDPENGSVMKDPGLKEEYYGGPPAYLYPVALIGVSAKKG